MTVPEREFILHRLGEARQQIEALLPTIDPNREIYPGWTIRQMLAHITGWDIATIDSLRAHIAGRVPATPADRGINEYNERTVSSRQDLDLDHVMKEWRSTRQVLKRIIQEMPDKKFFEPLIVPWGEKGTVAYLVEVLTDHEEEHARDIQEWSKKNRINHFRRKATDMSITVKAEKLIKAPPAQVYFTFTRAIALHEWLCDFATVAPHPGGRMYLWWHGDFYSAGEYTALEENKSISFSWFGRGDPGPSRVEVTLKPKDGGTQVILAHTVPEGKDWKGRAEEFQRQWAISLENLASVLETGMDKRVFDRPMLGINISDFSAEIAKAMGIPVAEGMRLDHLIEEMGAFKAGLRKNDVLVELGGKPITNDFGSLMTALQGRKGGEQVEVVFYRGPEKKTVTMELSRRPIPAIPWEPGELAKAMSIKYDEDLAALEQCLAGVSEAEADLRPASGEWSAKDTLAHLIHTERNYLGNLDDVVGGYERLSDDWGGNIDAHIRATVAAYGNIPGMLNEFRQLADEMVAFLAGLPAEFVARKSTYFSQAWQMLQDQTHTRSHIEQITAAIAASRQK